MVASSVYYLKHLTQLDEILLVDGEDWPTDTDEREQAITIEFTAKAYTQGLDRFNNAVMRFVAYLYENRGDCTCDDESASASGASLILGQLRIARV